MYRVMLRLTKGEQVKYLSHLDMLRAFEYALRRAKLPVAFSQGFNPRQRLILGSAIGVGVTSGDERIIVELSIPMDSEAVKDALNAQLPPGIEIMESESIPDGVKSPISAISASVFRFTLEGDTEQAEVAVEALFAAKEIPISRIKHGERNSQKVIDLRPILLELRSLAPSGRPGHSDGDESRSLAPCGRLTDVEIVMAHNESGGVRPQDFAEAVRNMSPDIIVSSIRRIRQIDEKALGVRR
jgi:radical SAM-linked protein